MAFVAVAATAPGMSATSATAATPHYSYSGHAYGTTVTVGSVVKSERSALVTQGCTSNGNLHRTNSTAAVKAAPAVQTGTVATTADTYASPVRSKTSATTNQVNLLNGRIRATAVKAVSSTARTSTGFALSSSGTTLTGLAVNGRAISASTAPNTRIALAGFGYLMVNEQVRRTNSLSVSALRLVITNTNALGLAVGTNVIVSHATSGLSGPVAGVLAGYAYGSQARVGTTFDSGPSFVIFLPCLGTAGAVRSNTGAGVAVGTAVTTGTITNTVQGTVSSASTTAKTTATVQTANVLSGLVTATAVKAVAAESSNGSTYNFSSTGSTFGSLAVRGHPEIGRTVAPNTTVSLPGVGTLYLHRVTRTSRSISVSMIELVLSQPTNGLPAGTNIRVGVSKVAFG